MPATATPEFLKYSPNDIVKMGREQGLAPGEIAQGVINHRNTLETWGRENGGEEYFNGAVRLDNDTEEVLKQLRPTVQRQVLTQALPDPVEQQKLAVELEKSGYDVSKLSDAYRPVVQAAVKAGDEFRLPQERHYGAKVTAGGRDLANFRMRQGNDGMMDVGLTIPNPEDPTKESQALVRVPHATAADVQTEISKRQADLKEAERLVQMMHDDAQGDPDTRSMSYRSRADKVTELKQRIEELQTGGPVALMNERVREELKKPEWRGKIGEYAGGAEFYKGLETAGISGAALLARAGQIVGAPGADKTMQDLAEIQSTQDLRLGGSTRRDLEGGLWNSSVKSAQQSLGQMAPFMAGGMVVRAGLGAAGGEGLAANELAAQQAGRLGAAGAGMSASAAGSAELETQRKIDAAEKAGDTAKAERLRAGRDLHALLTGITEGAVERLGAGQTQNIFRGGLGHATKELGKEGGEEVITGGIQRAVVDPVTLDERPNVFAPMPQELLTGVMAAGPISGGSAIANWNQRTGDDNTIPNSKAATPGGQTADGGVPGGNPFGGPINAPPQRDEAGNVVAPGPQVMPTFQDDPYGTVAPQPAGGNVLRDFNIPRTPEAQAAYEQRQQEYAQSQATAQGQMNRAGGRMPMIPDNPLGYRDILDFVNDNPLHIPTRGSEAAKAGEYDWTQQYEMPKYYRKFLASSERGMSADQLAQMAHDEGYISQPTPDALMEQIQKTIRERTQHRVEFRRQLQAQNDEERRLTNFDKAQQKASPVESTVLPLAQVIPGDEFTLGTENVRVKHVEHDEDGNVTLVQIEDGKKFGVLNLDPQNRAAILVDEFKPLQRGEGGSGPEAPNAEPDPFMPAQPNRNISAEAARAFALASGQQGGSLPHGLKSMFGSTPEGQAGAQPGRTSAARGVAKLFSLPASSTESNSTKATPALLTAAYEEAAKGSSTQMVTIKSVFEAALKMQPDLKVPDFLDALHEADNSNRAMLEVYDKPDELIEAGDFQLRNASGVPSVRMMMVPQEEDLAMPAEPEGGKFQDVNQAPPVVTIPHVDIPRHPEGMMPALRLWLKGARAGIAQRLRALTGEENPIDWSKLQSVKAGENPLHHFQAVAALPELYRDSVSVVTTPDKRGVSPLQYVRRYAWAMFPDGKRRHVLITGTLNPNSGKQGVYSLEALDVEVREAPLTYMAEHARAAQTAFDQGTQPVKADDSLQSFMAGIKPEHRAQAEELLMPANMQRPAVTGPLPSNYSGAQPTLPTTAQAWSGKVQTLKGIRDYLMKSVGLPAIGVGRFKKALGIYRVKPESIRLQAINDIPVLAHEIGHALHYRVLSDTPGRAPTWGGQYDGELMPMGAPTSLPNYTADMVRKEGIAEFVRLWLTSPAQARAQAPVFSAFFEAEMEKRNPKMAEALKQAQEMIADYIAMPEFEKAKAQIVFDPEAERVGQSAKEWMRSAYAKWVDTLSPALRVAREAAQMNPSLETTAKLVETLMENHRGGWSSKAHADIFGNQTDLHGNRTGEGMSKILAALQPGDHAAFSAYLALKRAMEIESQDKRSGFENAHPPASEMQALEARFESVRKKLLKWSDNELQLLIDGGILDGSSAAAMRQANQDYVPFYRLYEKLNNVTLGPEQSKNSGGFVDLNSGIRRLKGSDRAIMDPLQSLMKNAFMFRKIAEQNNIGVQFFDLIRQVQGHGKWGEQIQPKMGMREIKHEQIVALLKHQGVIQDESDLPTSSDLTLRLFEAMKTPDTGNGEVIIFKQGKREHWQIKDPLLMEALKTADADAVKLWNFFGPTMTKLLTLPTRVLRFGATGGPWFALPNFVRDQFTAGLQSKSGYIPFWDGLIGAGHVLKNSDVYQRWIEAGGKFHGITTGNEAFKSLLEDALPKDPSVVATIGEMMHPRNWLRLLGAAGQIMEEATRVQEFSRMMQSGATPMEAANASKIVSMNFARAGERGRALNMLVAFTNAQIQQLDMVVNSHKDPTRRLQTILRGVMLITVPSVLCWYLGKDDEEIQNLPEWRKNLFWNLNLKPVARALGREGFVLSIPKPFLMGAMYGTSVERMLDYATARDPNGWKKAFGSVYDQTISPLEMVSNLAGFRPIWEVRANHDDFRKRPIVPEQMQDLPPAQQYDPLTTSQTARLIGQFTNQSPMMIDHLVRGYFATAGKWGVDAIDWGMQKLGVTDVAPPPRKDLMEWPILNRFAGTPYAANVWVDRFYKASSEMEGVMRVWNKQADQMTSAEHKRWWEQYGPEVMEYSRTVDTETGRTGAGDVRKAQRALSELNGAMKEVQQSRVLSPDVKRARLMELAKQRNLAAEWAFKNLFPATVKQKHF